MKTLALTLLLTVFARAQEPSHAGSKPVSSPSAGTPAVDPAMAADVHRLLEDAGIFELLRQQIDRMMQPTLALMKQNPNLSPEFIDETMRRAKTRLTGPEVEQMAVEEYAKFFTRDDIQQMIAFQESPVGRKARQVNSQMLAELSEKMSAFGESVGREAATQVLKEHPEYSKKPSPPEPASSPQPQEGAALRQTSDAAPGVAPQNPAAFSGPHLDEESAEARLLKKIEPSYPPLAKAARIQGSVRFVVLLGTDGKVESMQLISGHPLLVDAAREAVKQWEYQPLLFDGKPARVLTQVTVNFHLDAP
jgi:TonB family protein